METQNWEQNPNNPNHSQYNPNSQPQEYKPDPNRYDPNYDVNHPSNNPSNKPDNLDDASSHPRPNLNPTSDFTQSATDPYATKHTPRTDAFEKDAWNDDERKHPADQELNPDELAEKNRQGAIERRKEQQAKFKIIDNARYELVEDTFLYPFAALAVGQGFHIPLEAGNTMDKLTYATHRQVNDFCFRNSEVELNEDGDEVLENITIRARVRNRDGSFVLDGNGLPKLTASSVSRPRLIGPRFTVVSVYRDNEIAENVKAEADGVLVIRLD
jgi:hypothetical protein